MSGRAQTKFTKPKEMTADQIRDRILETVPIMVGHSAIRLDLHIDELMTVKGGIRRKVAYKLGIVKHDEWPPPAGWRKAIKADELWILRDAFRIARSYNT